MDEFVEPILNGKKIGTIRSKAGCRPGDRLKLYTGWRTKKARHFATVTVTHVEPVVIASWGAIRSYKPWDSLNTFARRDGFKSWAKMRDWFMKRYGDHEFHGEQIIWDPNTLEVPKKKGKVKRGA